MVYVHHVLTIVLFPLKLKLFGPVQDIVAHTVDHEMSTDVALQVRGFGVSTTIVGRVLSWEIVIVFPVALHPFDPVDIIVYVPALFTTIPVVPLNVAIIVEPLIITAVPHHAFPVSVIVSVLQDRVVPLLVNDGVGAHVFTATDTV
jgi:hypothetical protein